MRHKSNSPILFELLRAYTTMAYTLNLSKAVKILGGTRQTVRRHIDLLEEIKGGMLFDVRERKYHLTKFGSQCLKEAEYLLKNAEAWKAGVTLDVDGLETIKEVNEQGRIYWSQQHRINRLWADGSPLLQCGLYSWSKSKSLIENKKLKLIRPYMVIYRRYGDRWVCVEIGEKSSYAAWYGLDWAKSNVGHTIGHTPAGSDFANTILRAYNGVYKTGGVRFDHVFREIPQKMNDRYVPVSFQRLLLGLTFPDNSPALAVLIDRTHQIDIDGLAEEKKLAMPKKFLTIIDSSIISLIKKKS